MPRESIIIEFKPKGHPELIAAIKKLNVETKKLTGSSTAVTSATKGVTAATKKFSGVAAGLTAKLKAHNVTWKQLGVSNALLKKGYDGSRLALEKMKIAMAAANKQGLLQVRNNRLLANSFATLRSKLLLVSFGAMLVERAFVSLVKAYGTQEAADKKLQVGLANVAGTTKGVTQRLMDYSSALQKTTAFGDEMITTGMVQFTTFGLNEKAIKALTPQVLNVARAIQTVSGTMPDLNSLFIAFGKATTTGIGTLTRYGVVLTETERAQLGSMDANESAVKIAEILERQYGGLAEAYAKTTLGMLEAAAAARGDAAEAFGKALAPAVLAVSKALKAVFEAMNPARVQAYTTAMLGVVAATGLAKLATIGLSGAIGAATRAMAFFTKVARKNPFIFIATLATLAAGAILDYFGVFEDDPMDDATKRMKKFNAALEEDIRLAAELKKAQEDGVVSLQKELDLLNAKTELQKRLINLGHEASSAELRLMNAIIRKNEALEAEKRIKKELIQLDREEIRLLKALEAELTKQKSNLMRDRVRELEDAIKTLVDIQKAEKTAAGSVAKAHDLLSASLQKQLIIRMKLAGKSDLKISLMKSEHEWTNKMNDAIAELAVLEASMLGAKSWVEVGLLQEEAAILRERIMLMGKNAEESAKLIQLMHDSAVALELKTKVEREAADLAKKIISLQGETTAGKIEEIITERAFIEKHKEALVTIRDGVKDYSIYNQLLAKLAARFRDLATIEQPDLDPGEFRGVMQVADPKEALDVRLGVLSADAANRLDLERAIINETNLLVDQKYLTEEEGMDHHVERMKQLEAEILENKKMSLGEATQMTLDSFSAMTSAMSTQINARMKNEIDVLKGTMKYKRADSDARKKMEKDITDSFGKEKERVAKYEKAASFAQASISIAEKIAKAIPNVVLMGIIAAMGAIQLAAIATTPIPKFATGGMIGGRRHSSGGTMIEAEAGEFVMRRSAVQSVGLENLNAMNAGGGGGSVTVNVSGNVLTQDFVEGELAENIKEAIRRGTDFGIS